MYGTLSKDPEQPAQTPSDHEAQEQGTGQSPNRVGAFSLAVATASIGSVILLVAASIHTSRHGLNVSKYVTTSGVFKSRGKSDTDGGGAAVWTLSRNGYDPLPYFNMDESDPSSILTYAFLDKYQAVVEPYAEMNLYVEGYSSSATTYYEFEICKSDDTDGSTCKSGKLANPESTSVTMACTPFEEMSIKVIKYNDKGDKQGTTDGTAICMYVRRELRSLTSDDLDAAMDAMYALYSTDNDEGKKLYGDNFHNSTYFVEAHHFNAAWRDADHIHEGLGFLTQHIKITNIFEKSMQSFDPSVSLPYWDFTIDEDVFTAFAFTSKTFGSIAQPTEKDVGWTYRSDKITAAAIENGRWKNLKTDYNYKFSDLLANFGYLRAPWNANPSPYVSRFSAFTTELPECSDHYRWLEYSTFSDFMSQAPYSPHASTHGAIGSVFGCDLMDPLLEAGLIVSAEEQVKLCQKWGFMMKELYRKDYLISRTDCSYSDLSYEGVDCGFSCNEERIDTLDEQLEQLISSQYVGTLKKSQWGEWKDFVCTGDASKIFVGDHVESASPGDPSFWPIHPTQERLLHAKLMAGGFKDGFNWATDPVNDYVCDKYECFEGGVQDIYDACCYGHYEDDQLLDFINADKESGYGPTNGEMLADTDPTSKDYAVRYIYDGFTWDHCDEDFVGLLSGTVKPDSSSAKKAKVDSSSLYGSQK